MNFDQYKFSIEAHPLQVLYTKYNANDVFSQYQSVRPLGRIRQERRLCSGYHDPVKVQFPEAGEGAVHGKLDMKLNTNMKLYSQRTNYGNDHQGSCLDLRGKDNNSCQTVIRSKRQAFEDKYKIAASRTHVHEQPPSTMRQNKCFDKKIVHLPLFRINLKKYVGEEEVSRTVAKARESLRELIDLNKAKLTGPNIKNYEFNAPMVNMSLARTSNVGSPRMLTSQPFHAKPALKSTRDREPKVRKTAIAKIPPKVGASETHISVEMETVKAETDTRDEPQLAKRQLSDIMGPEDEPDDSMLSLAIRPDTSLTLGTTMHQIDSVFKSPTSEELRELSETFKSSETRPSWPSPDGIQTILARNQSRGVKSRTPFSRPATVLNDVSENEEEEYLQSVVNRHTHVCSLQHEHHVNSKRPVLRYTSQQSTYKLDPIIVPSHTSTECPMCNIYQRDVETPCPPNTPNTSQFMFEPQTRPVLVQGTRVPGMLSSLERQEILRISRINMAGTVPPVED